MRYNAYMHAVNIAPENVFQAVAEPSRIRIVRLLAVTRNEACLCELVDSLLEPQYNLSRHLKVLRQMGLLAAEKDGRFIYHTLVATPSYLNRLWACVQALPDPNGTFAADLKRFKDRVRLRVAGRCRAATRVSTTPQPSRAKRFA